MDLAKAFISHTFTWILITIGIIFQQCAFGVETSAWLTSNKIILFCFTSDIILQINVSSEIQCGFLCFKERNCTSFQYVHPTCYLMNIDHDLGGCSYPMYAKPYTKYTPSLCHTNDGKYHTVQLTDGDIFTYRIVEESATTNDAREGCVSSGGSLAKVSSVARIEYLSELMKCLGFRLHYFIVDGSYDNSKEVWLWENGELMSILSSHWAYNEPSEPASNACLMFRYNNFYSKSCDESRYYICEKA